MPKKVKYIEKNGKYLIIKEDGTSELLKSTKEFNTYLTKNNLKK